jgi:hypothetical protein
VQVDAGGSRRPSIRAGAPLLLRRRLMNFRPSLRALLAGERWGRLDRSSHYCPPGSASARCHQLCDHLVLHRVLRPCCGGLAALAGAGSKVLKWPELPTKAMVSRMGVNHPM